jgi:hypothetical protein
VPFSLSLPVGTNRVQVWTLDERGQRRATLPIRGDNATTLLNVDTNANTLWYELEVAPLKTAWQLWREEHFTAGELADPATSSPSACPAADRVPNLWKYLLGLAPRAPVAPELLPQGALLPSGGDAFLSLTYRRLKTASDVQFTPQVSGDLLRWAGGPEQVVTAAVVGLGAAEQYTVRDTIPVHRAAQRFLRLDLSLPLARARDR